MKSINTIELFQVDIKAAAKIAVVMPAYNEERTIGEVICDIKKVLPSADIVVVVDKMKDNTAQIADNLGATVLRLPLKLGMGCAVQAGLKYVSRLGYEFAIRMDSDGQHIPAEIPRILGPVLNKDADLAVGSRYLKDSAYRAPMVRRGVVSLLAWIVSWIYGRRFTDTTSGFKAMNRKVIDFLCENYPVIGGTPTLIVLRQAGFKVIEVPVEMQQRQTGNSYFTSMRKLAYVLRVFIEILALFLKKNISYPKEAG